MSDQNAEAVHDFEKARNHAQRTQLFSNPDVSVEAISSCVKALHTGKACGPDDLSAEHLLYAHPSLIVHLKLLFSSIFTHGFVPDSFGAGIIVPLIKDKTGNLNDTENYRPITLIPVISKLFESLLLNICQTYLPIDDLQLGFKPVLGCTDAIFALKSSINYFNSRGSCVYAAALDLRKAFDSVNHYKLFKELLNNNIPVPIVDIICNWYGKFFVTARWNGSFSSQFHVGSGVRQGSTLSPALFNLLMHVFVFNLRRTDMGCHIKNHFYGCFLYADDIILLSPSVNGLQVMLNVCYSTSSALLLKFNCSKSYCIQFGKGCSKSIDLMSLGDNSISWVDSLKYLGVHFMGGRRNVMFDIDPLKRSFYRACNCIASHASNLDEILHLHLQETYSLSLLTYALPALTLSARQSNELNVCWNSVYHLIFGFNKWESVKSFINGLGRLNFTFLAKLRRCKLYFHLIYSENVALYNLFWTFLLDNFHNDDCLALVFMKKHDAITQLYNKFDDLCTQS